METVQTFQELLGQQSFNRQRLYGNELSAADFFREICGFNIGGYMTLILVMDNDCAIGRNGGLLCRLPEDMKNFRAVTLNSTVIMGRKTYESFPKRPLPDRENLVLSRNAKDLEGAKVFADIDSLMKYVKTVKNKVFVIGGGEIYKQLAPYCDEALITRLYENMDGDVFFEDIEHDPEWELAETSFVIETGCKNIRLLRFVRKNREK